MNGQTERAHEIQLTSRKELRIIGVKEVESFDETGALLQTLCGELNVEGADIHVKVLDVDRGEVVLNGRIDGIFYAEDSGAAKKGFFSKRNR